MSSVDVSRLNPIFVQYDLGKHNIDDNVTGNVPVFLEGREGRYFIRARLGGLNHWYLNTTPHDQHLSTGKRDSEGRLISKYAYTTYWRYKTYSAFKTISEAADHFNRVVYGDLKQKPSEIPLTMSA